MWTMVADQIFIWGTGALVAWAAVMAYRLGSKLWTGGDEREAVR